MVRANGAGEVGHALMGSAEPELPIPRISPYVGCARAAATDPDSSASMNPPSPMTKPLRVASKGRLPSGAAFWCDSTPNQSWTRKNRS